MTAEERIEQPERELTAQQAERDVHTINVRLFMQVRPTSYDPTAMIGFLRVLLRKILIICTGSSPPIAAKRSKPF